MHTPLRTSAFLLALLALVAFSAPAWAGGIVTELEPKPQTIGQRTMDSEQKGPRALTPVELHRQRAHNAIALISMGLLEQQQQAAPETGTIRPEDTPMQQGEGGAGCASAPGQSGAFGWLSVLPLAWFGWRRRESGRARP